MQAFVSGQAGIAILVEGTSASIINANFPDQEEACSPKAINYLLQGTTDIQIFSSARRTEIKARLIAAWEADRALFFVLSLLSDNEPD